MLGTACMRIDPAEIKNDIDAGERDGRSETLIMAMTSDLYDLELTHRSHCSNHRQPPHGDNQFRCPLRRDSVAMTRTFGEHILR